MLFARGTWPRPTIGFELERQRTAPEPGGRSSQGIRRALRQRRGRGHASSRARRGGPPPPRRACRPPRTRRRTSTPLPLPVELGDGREQHLRVRVQRVPEHVLRPAHLDDAPSAQDHRAVADVVAEREVVGDEEDPEAARFQVAEQVQHVDARRGVEHADDLVRDEEPMSSRSARATSSRWSWPPDSWCGYLFRQSPGLRLTASSALLDLRVPLVRGATPGRSPGSPSRRPDRP